MTLEDLMLFYADQSNKEFDLVIAKDKELDVIDFAHQQFCHNCAMFLMKKMMLHILSAPSFAARLGAGKHLFELDQIEKKYRDWN